MNSKAFVVCDLAYGDSGKGGVVDYLCEILPDPAVVRFNGGSQCGHNVHLLDGKSHTFAQFGSGTFHPGVKTFYTHRALFNPLNLVIENEHLIKLGITDAMERFYVSLLAPVITPYHVAYGRLQEATRGNGRHGSCGEGIGSVRFWQERNPSSVLTVKEMGESERLRRIRSIMQMSHIHSSGFFGGPEGDVFRDGKAPKQIARLYAMIKDRLNVIPPGIKHQGTLVYEGGQGVLLDESYGFHPYTTWSDTTPRNALQLAASVLDPDEHVTTLGVIRTYMTRHGPGPFPSEIPSMVYSHPELDNAWGQWQGAFRVGALDLVALRYSLAVCDRVRAPITGLAVTHLDKLTDRNPVCTAYRHPSGWMQCEIEIPPGRVDLGYQGELTKALMKVEPVIEYWSKNEFLTNLQDALGLPVLVESWGPTRKEKTINLERYQLA